MPVPIFLVNNQSIDRNGKLIYPVNLFPNPATDVVNIAFDFPVQNNVQIEVINSNSLKVDARQYPNPNGLINFKYPLQNLSSGIYLFNIIYDGQNITKRLNVIK